MINKKKSFVVENFFGILFVVRQGRGMARWQADSGAETVASSRDQGEGMLYKANKFFALVEVLDVLVPLLRCSGLGR